MSRANASDTTLPDFSIIRHYAEEGDHKSLSRILNIAINHGGIDFTTAIINVPSEGDGWTALMLAASSGNPRCVDLLISNGGNPRTVAADGRTTALTLAQENREMAANFGENVAGYDESIKILNDAIAEIESGGKAASDETKSRTEEKKEDEDRDDGKSSGGGGGGGGITPISGSAAASSHTSRTHR